MDAIPETSAKEEQLLEHVIEFLTTGVNPPGFSRNKKQAVHGKAAAIVGNLNMLYLQGTQTGS